MMTNDWLKEASDLPDDQYKTLWSNRATSQRRFRSDSAADDKRVRNDREAKFGAVLDGMTLLVYRRFVAQTLRGAARDSALQRFPPVGIIRQSLLMALEAQKETPAVNPE